MRIEREDASGELAELSRDIGVERSRRIGRAEREARRAAMEARMEARARDDADRRVYSSSGGRLSRESEFY